MSTASFKEHVLRAVLLTAGRLPLRWLQRLGTMSGWAAHLAATRGALVCRENIATCFPGLDPAEQRRLARRAMVEAGRLVAETAFAWGAAPARCRELIVGVEGEREVDAIDGPVVFLLPHLGNWEILNHYLGHRYGLTHMYQRFRSAAQERVITALRSRSGTRFVEADASGVRAQIRRLREGGTIGSMPDQEPPVHDGEFAPFFGVDCLTSPLVPKMARRTGATPVLVYCKRLANGRFNVVMRPLGKQLTTATMNAAIECAVRSGPEQYLWTYKRFRSRPDGEPERYQFRQHAIPAAIERALLRASLRLTAALPPGPLQRLAAAAGRLAWHARLPPARTTRKNLEQIERLPVSAGKASLAESARTLAEAGVIWHRNDIDSLVLAVEGETEPDGAIILTAPLGNRELVMRYLARRTRLADYYHPNKRTALDDLIRHRRNAWGIALAPETTDGIDFLVRHLDGGGTVTLCPDQQPRLRAGLFVPFFGVSALTTRALPALVRRTGAPVRFGVALRDATGAGFRLAFHDVPVSASMSDRDILAAVNSQLETLIADSPGQYRWSDKRFNIRPADERKFY